MATFYFTNNSDSGSGSFRDALTSSSPGDTIEPDPAVDWGGEIITISLSSPIAWGNRSRTISGGLYHRIRFDGQGAVNHVNFSNNNTITFEKCDFVRGYRETFGAVFQATNASPTITFLSSFFGGNKSDGDSAAYDLSSNSSSYKYDVTAINCVIAGDAQTFVTSTRAKSVVYKNCTFIKNLSTPNTSETTTFSNCIRYINSDVTDFGFVNVPATVYDAESWSPNLWQDWDARLKPNSTYLTGYNGEETTDFLGHTRKQNGALGAFEGAWFVAKTNETKQVNAPTVVDYAEIQTGASVEFEQDTYLTIKSAADIGACSLNGVGVSFLAVPSYTDTEQATVNGVTICTYGAGVTAVSCTVTERTAVIKVTKNYNIPVNAFLIMYDGSDSWNILQVQDEAATIATDKAFYIKAFDGENFVTSDFIPRVYWYKGNESSGSFSVATDWAINSDKDLTCNATPTIKSGVFHCEK